MANKSYLEVSDSFQTHTYLLSHYHFSFTQGIDEKGQAQTDVRGGTITAVIDDLPSNQIIKWGMSHFQKNKGKLKVEDQNSNKVLEVKFEKGACVSMNIQYAEEGSGYVSTSITIVADEVTLGTITHTNKWVK